MTDTAQSTVHVPCSFLLSWLGSPTSLLLVHDEAIDMAQSTVYVLSVAGLRVLGLRLTHLRLRGLVRGWQAEAGWQVHKKRALRQAVQHR